MAAAARARAPRKTGRLARSIRPRRVAKSAWSVGSDVIYARIHEFGGTIVPKKSRFLVFQVNGRWVRAKSVHIPARPYIRPALAESGRFIRDEFRQAGKRVTAHLARD